MSTSEIEMLLAGATIGLCVTSLACWYNERLRRDYSRRDHSHRTDVDGYLAPTRPTSGKMIRVPIRNPTAPPRVQEPAAAAKANGDERPAAEGPGVIDLRETKGRVSKEISMQAAAANAAATTTA